jgi:hypothetical protein
MGINVSIQVMIVVLSYNLSSNLDTIPDSCQYSDSETVFVVYSNCNTTTKSCISDTAFPNYFTISVFNPTCDSNYLDVFFSAVIALSTFLLTTSITICIFQRDEQKLNYDESQLEHDYNELKMAFKNSRVNAAHASTILPDANVDYNLSIKNVSLPLTPSDDNFNKSFEELKSPKQLFSKHNYELSNVEANDAK